jgi:RNA recognition motif-containing protein
MNLSSAVYTGNLAYTTTEEDIEDFFRGYEL